MEAPHLGWLRGRLMRRWPRLAGQGSCGDVNGRRMRGFVFAACAAMTRVGPDGWPAPGRQGQMLASVDLARHQAPSHCSSTCAATQLRG